MICAVNVLIVIVATVTFTSSVAVLTLAPSKTTVWLATGTDAPGRPSDVSDQLPVLFQTPADGATQ